MLNYSAVSHKIQAFFALDEKSRTAFAVRLFVCTFLFGRSLFFCCFESFTDLSFGFEHGDPFGKSFGIVFRPKRKCSLHAWKGCRIYAEFIKPVDDKQRNQTLIRRRFTAHTDRNMRAVCRADDMRYRTEHSRRKNGIQIRDVRISTVDRYGILR